MENKREAVNIGITLSTQLISSSLAILAVFGAIITFLLTEKESNFFFILFSILMFLCFIGSIIMGGKGIDIARKDGFNNEWNLEKTKNYFNYQAILNIAGIIIFIPILFLGPPKENKELNALDKVNKNLESIITIQKNSLEVKASEIIEIKKQIDSLKQKFNKVKIK